MNPSFLIIIISTTYISPRMHWKTFTANWILLSTMTTESLPTSVMNEKHPRMEFWTDRWDTQMIGWHQKNVHPMLKKYGTALLNESTEDGRAKILVPLCGKTIDLHFLAKLPNVSKVFGVDGVMKALEEFANENSELKITAVDDLSSTGSYQQLEGKNITLLKGDFFALHDDDTNGKFDSVWDRASMVAIQPNLRSDYVETIRRVVKPGGSILLVTFDRRVGTDEAIAGGPPFSISEDEVRELYNQPWVESIELLEEVNEFDANPGSKERWEKQGLTELFELCFLIRLKAIDNELSSEL